MIKIRLKRLGKKKSPTYRIIVIDSKQRRDGRAIEELGYYNPIKKVISIQKNRLLKRLEYGAQPTEIVSYLIKKVIK